MVQRVAVVTGGAVRDLAALMRIVPLGRARMALFGSRFFLTAGRAGNFFGTAGLSSGEKFPAKSLVDIAL